MRDYLGGLLLPFVWGFAWCAIFAQVSPSPVIDDYDATSLPAPYRLSGDTTFCKGATLTIHGQDFKKAVGGEAWDTTYVLLGGVRAVVVSIVSLSGGNDDRIVCKVPLGFVADTCLELMVVKRTVELPDTFTYVVKDSVCLVGDIADVSYGGNLFCLGDPNPLPTVSLVPASATGSFCCAAGAPSFGVFPTSGEIPLHPGAVGANNTFLFVTDHPRCADTVAFAVEVRARQSAVATIQGQTVFSVCAGAGLVMADTAALQPQGGVFRSNTLVLANAQYGMFDPAQSAVGLHSLWYVPSAPCWDSVEVLVTILPTATAVVGYPSIPLNAGVATLCLGSAVAWPSFSGGSAGGVFSPAPAGLDIGPTGGIDPNTSIPGTYAVSYATVGACPDTVVAVAQLVIDTVVPAGFLVPQAQYCAGDLVMPVALSYSGLWRLYGPAGQVVATTAALPIVLPQGAAAGNYNLVHFTGGFCADTASVAFSVLATDDPTFMYPPTGNFCLGDPDPWPQVLGNAGYFTAVTPATVVDLDGRLHLAASGAGQHVVRHVTGGTCRDSTEVSVNVFGSASAVFGYAGSVFCSGDTNPLPVLLGTPGGVFSSDSGLVVDSVSGGIGLDLSLPGVWNVTYTLAGSCQAQFTVTVQVLATDSLTVVDYLDDHFCGSGLDPTPTVFGDTLGTFVAGGGIVFSNTDLGQLDLSAMVPGGPYVVYYDIDNRCAVDRSDSIWIDLPDDPAFSYPAASYCEDGDNPLPDFIAMQGGTFSEVTASVVFADSVTGEIDASQSVQGGPYFISYTTAGPCPETSTRQLTIMPKPLAASLTVAPDTIYCAGESLMLQATAGGAVDWRWYLSRSRILGLEDFWMVDSGLTGLDTVSVVLVNLQGCGDSLSVVLRGLPAPRVTASVLEAATNLRGSSRVGVRLGTDIAGTVVDWRAVGVNLRDINPDSGTTSVFGPGMGVDLSVSATFVDRFALGRLSLLLAPRNASCAGFADTVVVVLGPDARTIFVPEVFTPDGNGHNDTWMITCLDGVEPADYRIQVFNDAGGMVLDMDGLRGDWDGGALPDGVYWWVLRDAGGNDLQVGGVTIRRK